MLGVSVDYLLPLDVLQVHIEDLLTQEVDQSLNVLGYLLLRFRPLKLGKVDLRIRLLKEVNVKLVTIIHYVNK